MKISHFAAAVAAIAICGSTPALGSGNAQTSNTVGNCISDGLYGNEPNIEPFAPGGPEEQEPGSQAGRVVPSASPGPATIGGGSFGGGDLQAAIRAACAA